ncbi:polysaccharide deacetylase family protein [Desulfoferula mesophila]|uniref:Polysaccharide deacetylase n=1 Tax=Desulfoferula mesophila TaxID=3058419 RepID=A0AAU9E9I7_9BACT|nr:polysaccharide deacetylase [Desulfoferula mesophilus]
MSWWPAALAGLGAAALSARFHWWRPRLAGAPVLMYHQIVKELDRTPLPKLRVPPRALERQLAALERRGYRVSGLSGALAAAPGAKAAALTFDDAFQDFADNAWPLIKARGMGATVFVVTGQIGGSNVWDQGKGIPSVPLLSAEEIAELAAQGVEFGGHGHAHRDLTSLSPQELADDLGACQEVLTGLLGAPARSFAYPYGLFNDEVKQAVARAGFHAACATRPGLLTGRTDPLAIPRVIVKRSDTAWDFALKLTRSKSRW